MNRIVTFAGVAMKRNKWRGNRQYINSPIILYFSKIFTSKPGEGALMCVSLVVSSCKYGRKGRYEKRVLHNPIIAPKNIRGTKSIVVGLKLV
jgi:hypothetical protein